MIEFISQLPTEYQEVEYIQSSGTQYIDTGFVVNKSDSYVLEIDGLFPSQAQAYQGCNGYMQFFVSSKYGISNESSISVGNRDTVRIAYANQTATLTVNGSQAESKSWASYSGANVKLGVLRLGDTNNGWFSGGAASGTIYGYKVWKDEVLVLDCIPCYRKSDNIAGLYDLVNGVFYTNAGTGDFAKGKNSNAHADVVITSGGVIPRQYALRRRMMINASKGLSISDLPLGTLIRIADSDGGSDAANYEIADINNLVPGGVVLVRKNIHSKSAFGSSSAYPGSTLDNKMTSIYNSLPEKLQSKIMDATFALEGSGSITRKVFALTYTMAGFGANNGTTEGKALQHYNSKANRVKNYNGSASNWWLSSRGDASLSRFVITVGTANRNNPPNSYGVVPAFAISSETLYDATPNTDGSYNLTL